MATTTTWKPTRLDLALAVGIAALFPPLAGLLYSHTGAFLPMVLYYGLAWGLVKVRRGATGYGHPLPKRAPWTFYLNIGVILASLVCARLSPVIAPTLDWPGMLLTALIWAPLNAASEQLLWIYLFEAWDLYPQKVKLPYRAIGLLLFAAYVGAIHTSFWAQFLQTVEPASLWGTLFVLLTTVSGFLHIVVWRQSRHMVFTFIPHLLLNLAPIFWTHYSMLPYLFR